MITRRAVCRGRITLVMQLLCGITERVSERPPTHGVGERCAAYTRQRVGIVTGGGSNARNGHSDAAPERVGPRTRAIEGQKVTVPVNVLERAIAEPIVHQA